MKFPGKRVTNSLGMFNALFEMEKPVMDFYGFLYWRKTPRERVKFGITHLPWERLRMQQQGTDEEIQFDHIWMIQSGSEAGLKNVESALKAKFNHLCLHLETGRAGHTEWFRDISFDEFQTVLNCYAKSYSVNIAKVELESPYTATKSSECPFDSPSNSRHQSKLDIQCWQEKFWVKITT